MNRAPRLVTVRGTATHLRRGSRSLLVLVSEQIILDEDEPRASTDWRGRDRADGDAAMTLGTRTVGQGATVSALGVEGR